MFNTNVEKDNIIKSLNKINSQESLKIIEIIVEAALKAELKD